MIAENTPVTIGLVVIIVSALFVLYFRIEAKFGEANEKSDQTSRELSDYKLHVERNFVTAQTLEKTEERLIVAMDRLGARVETLISRIETLGTRFAEFSHRE